MVVGIKDAVKLVVISVMACCAVLVCTMFLNLNIDICAVKDQITGEQAKILYEAQRSTAVVVSSVSGGCLLVTTVIMLTFYIKHYIDTHKKELGILKALGYSNFKIAKNFWVFGISILTGTASGFAGAFIIMPVFYKVQNEDNILPEISIGFHPVLLVCLVIVPTVVFAVISVLYALLKLRMPVLMLIKDNMQVLKKHRKYRKSNNDSCSFIDDVRKNTLRSRKVLVFFIIFASFCFSDMTQMAFSMKDLSSPMMAAMILVIGLVLAFVTLFLAVTTVVNGNTKTIAMMRVFGYSHKSCCRALLGGYRPMSYIGFAVGTVYQYVLLRLMVDIVFRDMEGIPEYEFNVPVMFISLAVFIVAYESVMYFYSQRIKKISVKAIMTE